jgi:hypothetical protein
MSTDKAIPSIPEQEVGGSTNIETSETCNNIEEAKQLYKEARERLLDVNQWHELCGALSAVFKLTDDKGIEVNRPASIGDHFKIDIPGPGTKAGKGYDWVQVEKIEETSDEQDDVQTILMRVRPADNPTTSNDSIAHFFSDEATSNFIVMRDKNKVSAAVRGRNEVPNTSTDKLIDKTRNAVIGASAIAGFSSPQWSRLVHAWLNKK